MSALASLDDWACERCTWNNTASDLTCTMCYQVRVATKDAPVIWQWSTGHEWIPYDLDTTLALEQAYQQHQPALTLTHGFFAANPGYTVAFGARGGSGQGRARHVQTNHGSGMRRHVRRIAEDDTELFKPVSDDERRQAARCSVCQLELDDEAEDEVSSEAITTTAGEQVGAEGGPIARAASRQVSALRKSGSAALPQPVQPSTSFAGSPAATTVPPATSASSSSSSSADRVVRLAKCAPGHACWIKLKDGQSTVTTAYVPSLDVNSADC